MVKGRRQIYPMKTNALKVASVCQSKKIPEEKHRTAAVCFRGIGNVVITDIDIIGIVSYRIGALHIVCFRYVDPYIENCDSNPSLV